MANTEEYIIPMQQLKLKIGHTNTYNCTMQYSCFIQSKNYYLLVLKDGAWTIILMILSLKNIFF